MLCFEEMSETRKLLIATTNPSKFEEAKAILEEEGLEILGLKDFPEVKPVPETGSTFEENAMLKAKGYYEQTKTPCYADDGGLEVEYLGGAPGVNSHRWLGHEATDKELAGTILKKLEGVVLEKRRARLGGFAVFFNGAHLLKEENWVEGYIADKLMCEVKPGFPYRAILMIPRFGKAYGELTHEEHEEVNFRRKSLKVLKPKILELLK